MNKLYISTIPRNYRSALKKQAGSMIVLAIFVILIISLLGASLVSLQRDSAEGTSYEVYAARAYLSAYTGSEVALARLFPLGTSAANSSQCDNAKVDVTLPNDNLTVGFHGCSATYICQSISSAAATRYKIVSTAVCETSGITTRRQVTVEANSL